jgi:Asp/Glu/hydantoin racemase
MRIALIHALRYSPPPIEEAFSRLWPEAKLSNLLDDSLSSDLARTGHLDEAMHDRFLTLGRYAKGTGADAILFTCSAFGACIDKVRADLAPLVVHKPNQGMFAEATAHGGRIGLVCSFRPSLASLAAEFPAGTDVTPIFAAGALDALERGDVDEHDRLTAEAVAGTDVDLVALGQFSLARAADRVRRTTGKPVLTTPDAAVRALARALGVSLAAG